MRIDAHQHFWIYDPREYGWIDDGMTMLRRHFLPADLEPELAANGFEGCIAVQARQTLEETRWLLELAERASFIRGVVGWVDLRSPQLRSQLDRFAGKRTLVGVRHIVQSEPDDRFLMQPAFLAGMEQLQETGLAYDLLIYPRHLAVAAEFVGRFPRQRFVLDHLAKPPIREGRLEEWSAGIRALAEHPHVWCKLSGLVTEADWGGWTEDQIKPCLDVAFASFGPSRLMIGSDWPVCTLAGSYSRVMETVKSYIGAYPPAVREAILGGNAERFWGLQRRQAGKQKNGS